MTSELKQKIDAQVTSLYAEGLRSREIRERTLETVAEATPCQVNSRIRANRKSEGVFQKAGGQ